MSPLTTREQIGLRLMAELGEAAQQLQNATQEQKFEARSRFEDTLHKFTRQVLEASYRHQHFAVLSPPAITIPIGTSLRQAERLIIEATLRSTDGNVVQSAKILGIDRSTVHQKIKDYKLSR